MTNKLNKDICLAPYFSTWVSPTILRPCPVITGHWSNNCETIKDGINSSKWVELRKHFIANSCHDNAECVACAYAERSNSISTRQLSNDLAFEKFPINVINEVNQIIENDCKVENIYTLEYFPSNYCNYQCIMCNGGASSSRNTFEFNITGVKTELQDDLLEPDFYNVINNLTILSLVGGETILQPRVHELIDHLIDCDIANNITITMLTNVSSFPDSLMEKFKQFKEVFYTLSIDGTEDVIEYQRRGAKWEDVKTNAVKINSNFGSVVNYVLTSVNVFSFDKFVAWLHEVHLDIVFVTMENTTGYLGVESLPDELRLPLIEKLKMEKAKYTEQWCIDLLDEVVNILSKQTHDPQQLERFIEHIKIEDSVSKKSLVEVVPEWIPYFE
jgi:MoaA/NifB/PqqE/SkfB family radical SAM enzyme